ncbi:DUF1772 domain-containing protein [Microbacterium horticulturae]|uniref:DUF1772 domain-containing protein n=1 Tax=Microbacterium horticulturae TaxID=3028316 RepID=A0ABY8C5C7_9MICO|nr:anthrone oxygenase family protein [Microbacterium sp. KACC 23027]WEG10276.1 DUF1772 domain-containing protein [Microbacterium sp. KACC 23027]
MSAPIWFTILVWVTAALTMVNAGIYLAFSTFVLPALRTLPAGDAVRAMQRINEKAPRSAFMVPFIGSALGAAAVIVAAFVIRAEGFWWLIGGAVAALVAFFLTAAVNVPLNNTLAAATDANAKAGWARFDRPWAASNHLRAAISIVSSALLSIGAVSV